MSGLPEATKQADWIIPMMAKTTPNSGIACGAALAVTTTAGVVDLTSIPGPPPGAIGANTVNPNPLGHYVDFQADGGDVYVIFGAALADVTGTQKPAPATVNAVNGSGVITPAVGVCMKIASGTTATFKLHDGPGSDSSATYGTSSAARFVGYVTASSTATLRIYQSSP